MSGISVYKGVPIQRGSGFGGLFKSLGKQLLPVAANVAANALSKQAVRYGQKKGGVVGMLAKSVAPTLLNTTAHITQDVAQGDNIKTAVKRRGKAAAKQFVSRKTKGLKRKANSQSYPLNRSNRRSNKRKKRKRDIFDQF